LLGVGVLIKQHAVLAVPFVALTLLPDWDVVRTGPRRPYSKSGVGRRVAAFVGGLVLPLLAAGLLLSEALSAAWYWTVTFNFEGGYAREAARSPQTGQWSLLLALYAPLAALWVVTALPSNAGRGKPRILDRELWVLTGLIVAATAPAWPRYAPYHLHAAVPLLAVCGGMAAVTASQLLRRSRRGVLVPGLASLVTLGLLLGGMAGLGECARMVGLNMRAGPARAPFEATVAGFGVWVDAHAPEARSPILIYDLNSLLYRVLEREPPRPFAPQLAWIMAARDTEARWQGGIEAAQPQAVLVPAAFWDEAGESKMPLVPGNVGAWIRRYYHEDARFAIRDYTLSPPVTVVGLVRNPGGEAAER
jgi:hypothetical protein